MPRYVWDLSDAGMPCDSYAPGHRIHHIHFNVSMREPSVVIPVTASVDDDGLVSIEGDGLSLVRWNHRPALLRTALERFGGRADWKPRWHLLAVPTDSFMGSARTVFSMAAPKERGECDVIHRAAADGPPPGQGAAALPRDAQNTSAEHEARNVRLRSSDASRNPPAELDMATLRAAAAELGYWPATTDDQHLDKLRADNERFDRMHGRDRQGLT